MVLFMTTDAALMPLRDQRMICKEFLEKATLRRCSVARDLWQTAPELEKPQHTLGGTHTHTHKHSHEDKHKHLYMHVLTHKTIYEINAWHHPVHHHNHYQTHVANKHTHVCM